MFMFSEINLISTETYRTQSMATIREMSAGGKPTEVRTITMVTKPAWGIPAAPMLAAVAVILMEKEVTDTYLSLSPKQRLMDWIFSVFMLTWSWPAGRSPSHTHWPERWRWQLQPHTGPSHPCWWWLPPAGQSELSAGPPRSSPEDTS